MAIVIVESASCKKDSDCQYMNSCVNKGCVHKSLTPLTGQEWGGTICLILLAIAASAGGVGGSVVCSSISLSIFNFDAHHTTAITQAFVFGGSLTTVFLKLRDRHPVVNRPLIYYDVVLLIVSPILLGVTIGVLINRTFPSWLLLALLTLLVAYLTFDITFQGIRLYKKETEKKREKAIASHENITEATRKDVQENENPENVDNQRSSNRNLLEEGSQVRENNKEEVAKVEPINDLNQNDKNSNILSISIENKEDLTKLETNDHTRQINATDARTFPFLHYVYFLFLIGFSVVMAVLIGSPSNISVLKISSCSKDANGILAVYIIIMILLGIVAILYLLRKEKLCIAGNYKFDQFDLRWKAKQSTIIALGACGAGFIAGLLGLGGGYIIHPIFLHLKIRPEVSTVSSSFTILMSSLTGLIQYFVYGVVDWQYALWYGGSAFLGALTGILGLRGFVIRRGRPSILVLVLSITLLSALVTIPTTGIINALQQQRNGTFQLGFSSLC